MTKPCIPYKLLFIGLCLFIFSSCIEEYLPEGSLSDQKLVAFAELEAGELSQIRVGSTFSSSQSEVALDHNLTIVKVINFENNNKPEEYRYDPNIDAYRTLTFRPNEGAIYELHFDSNIEGFKVITGRSQVPYKTEYDFLQSEVTTEIVTNSEGEDIGNFEIRLKIDVDKTETGYFHLIPSIDDQNTLYFDEIITNKNAIHVLQHRDGILIDKSKLNDANDLRFKLKTFGSFDVSEVESSYLKCKLRSVTEEYYEYHLATSRQSSTNAGPYTLPVTTYTNMANGYGIFATFSTVTDSLLIE
ncbi:MAG: DUF4249 family protein [Saprospiraceae bacterium]|nr:DUF4249 family protein [Saprospiraceae bacterium]